MISILKKSIGEARLKLSRAISGNRWSAFAEDYYPVEFKPRWGYGTRCHPQINELLCSKLDDYEALLMNMRRYSGFFNKIQFSSKEISEPCWNNIWFSSLDAATLMYFLLRGNPKTYLEVGSGSSTKFARKAMMDGGLRTKLISIDPQPRAEIDAICDLVIRSPLERSDLRIYRSLEPGDIAFFDGSHRIFTNSDTTVFFLEIMPCLASGVLIHLHDIFWPDDYIPEWSRRLYSEQYILGAMVLSGMSKFEIILPNYFVSTNPRTSHLINGLGVPQLYPGTNKPGLSFWLKVK